MKSEMPKAGRELVIYQVELCCREIDSKGLILNNFSIRAKSYEQAVKKAREIIHD